MHELSLQRGGHGRPFVAARVESTATVFEVSRVAKSNRLAVHIAATKSQTILPGCVRHDSQIFLRLQRNRGNIPTILPVVVPEKIGLNTSFSKGELGHPSMPVASRSGFK